MDTDSIRNISCCRKRILWAALLLWFVSVPVLAQPPRFIVDYTPQPNSRLLHDIGGLVAAPDAIYVLDGGGKLLRFSSSGMRELVLTGRGGVLSSGRVGGLARTPEGLIIIAARGDDRIIAIDDKSSKRFAIDARSGAASLNGPAGIAYSRTGRIIVADRYHKRVAIYAKDGVFLFAVRGSEKEPLRAPSAVATDDQERIYVLDHPKKDRLSIYDRTGKLLARIDASKLTKGDRAPELSAIAVDGDGRLFVADSANGKLIELDWQNERVLARFGSAGSGRGQFRQITAIALSATGHLAIGDSGNHKIEVYDVGASRNASGQQLARTNVTLGEFIALRCSRAYILKGGNHLCLDRRRNRVMLQARAFGGRLDDPVAASIGGERIAILLRRRLHVFDRAGKLIFATGRRGRKDGEFRDPQGVALGSERIYVADTGNQRVQIFSRDGLYLANLGESGASKPSFVKPVAVVVDQAGNVIIADAGTKSISVYSAEHKLLYTLTGDEYGSGPYTNLVDLALDGNGSLYVLGSTAHNDAHIDVYRGPRHKMRFGASGNSGAGLARPTSLSVRADGKTIVAVHDDRRDGLVQFHYLQVPGPVGGLVAEGDPSQTQLSWQPLPDSFITTYHVYGATQVEAKDVYLGRTQDARFRISHKDARRYSHYRLVAVSGFGIKGPYSRQAVDHFQIAYQHYLDRDYKAAEALFAQSLKLQPRHGAALEYRGRALVALKETGKAVRVFDALADVPGQSIHALMLKTEALLAEGDYLAARAGLERALAQLDGNKVPGRLWLLCGDVSLKLGDAVQAIRCLEKARTKMANNPSVHQLMARALLHLGINDRAFKAYEEALRLNAADADLLVEIGMAEQVLGRHEPAIAYFEKALSLQKESARARMGMARSLLALDRLHEARTIALKMSSDAKQEAMGQYVLGLIAIKSNRLNEAVLSLNRASRIDQDYHEAWLALAGVYERLKDLPKAVSALERIVRRDPFAVQAWRELGRLRNIEGRYDLAGVAYTRAIALAPGDGDLHIALARIRYTQGRYHEAMRYAGEAARIKPGNVSVLELRAQIANAQGKSGEAIEFLKKALALDKGETKSAALHRLLGKIYFDNNLPTLAEREFKLVLKLAPGDADIHALLGRLYMERRQFKAAILYAARAVKLAPTAEHKLLLNTAYAERKKARRTQHNAPQLVLSDLKLGQVFSATYKQYAATPLGTVRVRNLSGSDYHKLSLSFYIKDYMDFPTRREIPLLKGKDSIELPLFATFSNKVLDIDEDTGVQVQLKLEFYRAGKRVSIELNQPMTIYGKNAIVWQRFNMVGAFVTPKDDVFRAFVRQGINAHRPKRGPLNAHVVTAMTWFNLLSVHGVRYQIDPNNPYSRLAANQVDYVQFPRETLRMKSGDCDDLTVLINAGLENLGVETAFVDVPGHLFLLFNTGVPADQASAISHESQSVVILDGTVWVPLEATMLATSFEEAWAEGARKYYHFSHRGKIKVVRTQHIWREFQPVTLARADYKFNLPLASRVTARIRHERDRLAVKQLERELVPYQALARARPDDPSMPLQLAIVYARYGLYDKAHQVLEQLIRTHPEYSAAYNNRGNIYLLQHAHERALEAYRYAERIDPNDAGIKINLAMAYYRLDRRTEAAEKYQEAVVLDAALAKRYRAFGKLMTR